MKKASRPGGGTKAAQKRPAQKKLQTKPGQPKKARAKAGLAEIVAQLALSAEKIAQAADRLTDVTARLTIIAEARHETHETPDPSLADSTTSQHESEATDETDGK
jgi:hypothetical protein